MRISLPWLSITEGGQREETEAGVGPYAACSWLRLPTCLSGMAWLADDACQTEARHAFDAILMPESTSACRKTLWARILNIVEQKPGRTQTIAKRPIIFDQYSKRCWENMLISMVMKRCSMKATRYSGLTSIIAFEIADSASLRIVRMFYDNWLCTSGRKAKNKSYVAAYRDVLGALWLNFKTLCEIWMCTPIHKMYHKRVYAFVLFCNRFTHNSLRLFQRLCTRYMVQISQNVGRWWFDNDDAP